MFLHSRGTGYGDNVGARAKRCLSKIAHLVGPVVGQNALPEMTRLILKRHALMLALLCFFLTLTGRLCEMSNLVELVEAFEAQKKAA